MKFHIRHQSPIFFFMMVFPAIVMTMILLFYVTFGIAITDSLGAVYFFMGAFIFCAAVEIISIILYLIDFFYGANIIVGSDFVDIRLFLRRKKVHFTEIMDVSYSHDEYDYSKHNRHHANPLGQYFYAKRWRRHKLMAQLDFHLTSGKRITLTEAARGYAEGRKRAMVDPTVNPDENVRLYQAYQCYCSAVDQYSIQHGLQITR